MHITKKKMPAWRAGLGLIAASALALVGCSAGTSEAGGDGVVEIEYFNFTAGEDHIDKLEAIIAAFEAENPDVRIRVQHASYDEYFTLLQTRIAGNTAPDTFELNYENFVGPAASGVLLDIESVEGSALNPSAYFPRAYDAFSFDGVQYGLPESFSVVVLYYNKALFDQAGLDYPTNDWSWADEQVAAEAITALGPDIWGHYQPIQFFEFYKSLAQSGGQFFNDDVTEATFNSPAGVEAATWLVQKMGRTMPTEAQRGGQGDDLLFQNGKIGMWHTGIWMFNLLQDMEDEWDIVVEPTNGTTASHFFANAAVVSANTRYPEQAVRWINYLASSEETAKQRIEGAWEIPAVIDEELIGPYLTAGLPNNRQAVFDALDGVVVPPVIERQQELQDIVTLYLERAQLGELTVQEALDRAVAEVNALL